MVPCFFANPLILETPDLGLPETNLFFLPGLLGPPVVPFYPFLGEGSPTKIDYRKTVGTLMLTSLLEDLAYLG